MLELTKHSYRNNERLGATCTSYHKSGLKYMAKLECCALATQTGSKLTSVSLAKMRRLCLFEPGTLFSRIWTKNWHLFEVTVKRWLYVTAFWPKDRMACAVYIATYRTRQASTFAKHRKYLSILIQQIVVFLISSQIEISSRCLFVIYLISIFIWPYFDVSKLKN
jgi:hypothetical protein